MTPTYNAPLTSLNAIKLSAREVARTFVAPPAFDALLHADNAILTGPRGSGKTTMLKMLQSEALEHWLSEDAGRARGSARAVGVFVGSDRTWNEQLAIPGEDVDATIRRTLTKAAFTLHVVRAISDAMDYRVHGPEVVDGHKRIPRNTLDEARLATRLSQIVNLDHMATSLASLRAHLSDRQIEIGRLRNRARRGGDIALPRWTDDDFLAIADAMAEEFNLAAGEPDQKWALLFDELELAPQHIVDELLGALRGSQPRLLFKLSLAPANARFTSLEQEHAPVPGQDYEHVPLTYARKRPALKFAKVLVEAILTQATEQHVPPIERVLGVGDLDSRDDFDGDEATPTRTYDVGSRLWNTFTRLRDKDETFAAYLTANSIDLDRLDELSPQRRAARLRKVRNLVVVRDFYLHDDGHRRSRKTFGLYTGAESVLSLPDGNPRMIIALVRQLFPQLERGAVNRQVTRSQQSAAINATLDRFLALLEAQQAVVINARSVSLMDLLDRIGDSLQRKLVESPFTDNMALSLRIPSDLLPEIEILFTRGINAGAFVHVPSRDTNVQLSSSIAGRQFRLSHLLAARYGLPIHLTPATMLTEHLPAEWKRVSSRRLTSSTRNSGPDEGLFDAELKLRPGEESE